MTRPCRSTKQPFLETQDRQQPVLGASLLCVDARIRGRVRVVADGCEQMKQVQLVALRLHSPSLKVPIMLDLSTPAKMAELKQTSKVTIKEVRSQTSLSSIKHQELTQHFTGL